MIVQEEKVYQNALLLHLSYIFHDGKRLNEFQVILACLMVPLQSIFVIMN